MMFKWEKLTVFAFKPYHGLVFLSYWLFATYWSFVFSSIGFYLAFQERIYANQMVICYFTIKLHKYSSWHGQSIPPYSLNDNGILIKIASFLKFLI